ncbi:MAG: tetratricopeptide repeat protein [Isosphaeraceae bacterium]
MSHPVNPPATEATESTAKPAKPRRSFTWLWQLLLGLPAAVVAVLMVGVLIRQSRTAPILERYREQSAAMFAKGDFRSALIGIRRMVHLSPDNSEFRLWMAVTLEQLGQVERAEALARTLAPLDERAGYMPAHLWLGQRLAIDSRGSRQRMKDAEEHLKRVLNVEPRNEVVKLLLGTLYGASGRPREARPLLEAVADGKPEVLLNLATICRMMGDQKESDRRVDQALQILSIITLAQPKNGTARALQAKALLTRGRYEDALSRLASASIDDPKEDEVRRKEQAMVCLVWAENLAREIHPKYDEVLKAIERGLDYDPDNLLLLSQLAEVLKVKGPEGQKARTRFEKLLAEGRHPAIVYLAYGNEAWANGRRAQAREFWEKSVTQKDFVPLAANNLAWDLAYNDPKNAERALELADKVVAAAPNDPRFRATRGQVLARLSRWKDARAELETATDAGISTPETHRALAEVYEKLGMLDKAAEQRRKAG